MRLCRGCGDPVDDPRQVYCASCRARRAEERQRARLCVRCRARPKRPGRGQKLCVECIPTQVKLPDGRKVRPCPRCGSLAPKRQGQHLCDPCQEVEREVTAARRRARRALARKPCRRCGKPKGPRNKVFCDACRRQIEHERSLCIGCGERPRRRPRAQYCEVCAAVAERARRRKSRERQRHAYRRLIERLGPEGARAYRRAKRAAARKRRREGDGVPMPRFVPSEPLVCAIDAHVARMRATEITTPGVLDAAVITTCERCGINERTLHRWRTGDAARVNTADRVLLALGLMWWEVYDPQGPYQACLSPLQWIDAVDLAARAWAGEWCLPDR